MYYGSRGGVLGVVPHLTTSDSRARTSSIYYNATTLLKSMDELGDQMFCIYWGLGDVHALLSLVNSF
jgi:hypothetical protein